MKNPGGPPQRCLAAAETSRVDGVRANRSDEMANDRDIEMITSATMERHVVLQVMTVEILWESRLIVENRLTVDERINVENRLIVRNRLIVVKRLIGTNRHTSERILEKNLIVTHRHTRDLCAQQILVTLHPNSINTINLSLIHISEPTRPY